ncbi:hypothetical protein [Yoonia sp. SS1-5]|uniref:Uncharacterized protein n=1 Tax=Yoonia rhodophyticola TaxID=3137370 RepID=A0AAN0MDT6_9RHOB
MSAPDTNLDKQAHQHRGPMRGMKAVLAFATILFVGLIVWTTYKADNPAATTPAELIGGTE